jgi:parallel beta-helix repeat protein
VSGGDGVKRNSTALASISVAVLLALAGCAAGGGDLDSTATAVADLMVAEEIASATATPAFMPVTIRIEADGSGDYSSLEEAVRNAPHQATIRMGAGTYSLERRLNVRRSLRLVGAGMDETEIASAAPGYAIRFTGDGPFGMQDLTVSRVGDSPGNVVVVRGGEIDFQRCRTTGAKAAYEYEEMAGLLIMGDTTGEVRDCVFELNDVLGVYVTEKAQPSIEDCLAAENTGAGIAYYSDSGGTASRNSISGCLIGIAVAGDSAPVLEENTCSSNELVGISIGHQASARASQNVCTGNEIGILVFNEAQPMLEANSCNDNEQVGIAFTDDAGGTASANECLRNQFGISLGQRARPTVEGNTCNENSLSGIAFLENAGGIASNNECASNGRFGISIDRTANPTVMGNNCHDNGWSDIERLTE